MELLQTIGLTPREIRVYKALLQLGQTSAGAIISTSGIPGSKIYETLDKLKKRGLVTTIKKDGRMMFTAVAPQQILHYLEQQKQQLAETVIPELTALSKEKPKKSATVYEGIQAIKSVYEQMLLLSPGETIHVMGAPPQAHAKLEPFLLQFNKRRTEKGINLKIIYHQGSKKYGKVREQMQHTTVRYLTENTKTPAWIDIFGDNVALFDISDTPSVVLIKDIYLAQQFLRYFESIWKICEKPTPTSR